MWTGAKPIPGSYPSPFPFPQPGRDHLFPYKQNPDNGLSPIAMLFKLMIR